MLFSYAMRVDLNFIWTLYANQLLNAAVKVYMMWRLAKQKWTNRGNQKQGFAGSNGIVIFREAMAAYLTTVSFAVIFLAVILYTGLLVAPTWNMISAIFGA